MAPAGREAPPRATTSPEPDRAGGPLVAALSAPVGAAFGLLARLRHRRALHPVGVAYLAEVELARPLGTIAPGRHRGIVRLSRGGGLPRFLPDIGGLAVRLCDVGGHGRHQDLLLSSSARAPVLRHLLVPTWFVDSAWFSSLVSFDDGERTLLFGGRRRTGPVEEPTRYELLVAEGEGPWEPLGEVVLGRRLDDAEAEALTTSPWNDAGGLRPVGVLNALRERAYRASQAGRGQEPSVRS